MAIDVVVRTPLPQGGNFYDRLGTVMSSYSHTISMDGGFESAQIEITTSKSEAAKWVQDGVGQHVVASWGGLIIWEGFIDSVDVSIGQLLFSRGPLMDVVNKSRVTWQKHTFGGIVPGGQYITDFASDLSAQIGFFELEGDIAGGTLVSEPEAIAIRDLHLTEFSRPQTRSNISSSGSEVKVSFSCLGYYRMLEKYYYLRAVDADIEATEKIKDVLDADPNGLFDHSRGVFETIGITVNEYEDWSRTASDIIFELASLGNSSNERLSFGVYEYRVPTLRAMTSDITYELSSGENGSIMSMRNGGPIAPEFVRPGYWMRSRTVPLAARSIAPISLRQSDRDVLIEKVTFQTPNQLSINGGSFDTFTQRLARFNFGLV